MRRSQRARPKATPIRASATDSSGDDASTSTSDEASEEEAYAPEEDAESSANANDAGERSDASEGEDEGNVTEDSDASMHAGPSYTRSIEPRGVDKGKGPVRHQNKYKAPSSLKRVPPADELGRGLWRRLQNSPGAPISTDTEERASSSVTKNKKKPKKYMPPGHWVYKSDIGIEDRVPWVKETGENDESYRHEKGKIPNGWIHGVAVKKEVRNNSKLMDPVTNLPYDTSLLNDKSPVALERQGDGLFFPSRPGFVTDWVDRHNNLVFTRRPIDDDMLDLLNRSHREHHSEIYARLDRLGDVRRAPLQDLMDAIEPDRSKHRESGRNVQGSLLVLTPEHHGVWAKYDHPFTTKYSVETFIEAVRPSPAVQGAVCRRWSARTPQSKRSRAVWHRFRTSSAVAV